MEIKLNKSSVSYYSKVLDIEFSREETSENIVPDTLPDIAEIIDADGMAILRGKDLSDGRISISGMVFGYILYRS
ncbi:MAG: peptidoglycan-binding protein LysM, partial [Oscillospiraceae bacterium]|nr:peptidoglycan-binding protein LysM [Oscillospiraceae bacterium]